MYKVFSALFVKEPDDETLEQVKETFGIQSEDSQEEVKRDFENLFLEPEPRAAPYESLYNFGPEDKAGTIRKASLEVQAFYETTGLGIEEGTEVVPDHLSVELLFMGYLVENGLIEKQRAFLREHLIVWVPGYCDEIGKYAATDFYREMADILKEFLLSEYELMAG